MNPTVFIIDDEADQVALVTAQLERGRRFATKGFTRAELALDEIRADPPDAVVCGLAAGGIDGVAFTRRLRDLNRSLPVIIVTPRGSDAEAEDALEAGATDFVTRPVEPKALETRLRRALEEVPARELLSSVAQIRFDRHGIVGSHPLVQLVREFVDKVATVPQVTALLLGESGTGKNMVARAIHGASQQSAYRFVEVNCAAIPGTLLEAELFGYEKGAFTDARQGKKGLVEVADGGTLFLDEIGSMPLELQAKLLTFLESRAFRRIGSVADQTVQTRVIAATNVDLAGEVRAGRFREDLYYRLNVASQVLPPLRLIRSDIPAIARHFVKRAAEYFAKPVPEIDAEGDARLQRYDWPGNARELRNVIERSMIFSRSAVLEIPELTPTGEASAQPNAVPVPRGLTLDEVERLYIEATLREVNGSINEAARRLGVSRKVLWQRRKRHGIGAAG
ncbi:MAG TPA: sigma-54 dependent transcriptional regulator [Longimicrobiaceae bacterium]|nr:sigma-54 dependent transcriptional regulator [Longimicrobiaceae bacterium]